MNILKKLVEGKHFMHELTIALSVIRIVEEVGHANDLKHIHKIIIRKGELSGILEDAFLFAFESLRDSALEKDYLEGTKIEFVSVQAIGECMNCHSKFKLDRYEKRCPYCKGEDIYYDSDYDFFVESIEGE